MRLEYEPPLPVAKCDWCDGDIGLRILALLRGIGSQNAGRRVAGHRGGGRYDLDVGEIGLARNPRQHLGGGVSGLISQRQIHVEGRSH